MNRVRRVWYAVRRPVLIASLATGTVLGFGSGFASVHRWHEGGMHRRGPCHGDHDRHRGERPDRGAPDERPRG